MKEKKIVIIGSGPAGSSCAMQAVRTGGKVVIIENSILGGFTHSLDCIPSKSMLELLKECRNQNNSINTTVLNQLRERIKVIENTLRNSLTDLMNTQKIEIIRGVGTIENPNKVSIQTKNGMTSREADIIVLATGASQRIPEWYPEIDGKQILLTQNCYPPKEVPEHITIIGSGVTGVEMTHLFSQLGSNVTLLVSRQQVLPNKDPEVAEVLENKFTSMGIKILKGARASSIENNNGILTIGCEDGRKIKTTHALLAIGSIPNDSNLELRNANIISKNGFIEVDHNLKTNIPNIYAAGDLVGGLNLSSIAIMQGKKIAEHAMGLHINRKHRHIDYNKAPSAIFTDPEIADVGLAEAEAFSEGRKIRVTKVPFVTSSRALMQGDTEGFAKIISDPYTGYVLGGSIVGKNASELIALLSLAVNSKLKVDDLAESMSVHPTLTETVLEASE